MEKNIDKKLFELMQKDRVGKPNPQIENRLMYAFLLKNSNSNLRKNSFSGFTGWLFSFKSIGVKVAALSFLLFFSLMNTKLRQEQSFPTNCDSTLVEKVLVLDTARFSREIQADRKDTLF